MRNYRVFRVLPRDPEIPSETHASEQPGYILEDTHFLVPEEAIPLVLQREYRHEFEAASNQYTLFNKENVAVLRLIGS